MFSSRTAAARFARAERCLLRDGDRHTIPIADLEVLAAAARTEVLGVPIPVLEDIYPAIVLHQARAHQDERVRVDQRGTDVVLNLPKSVSAPTPAHRNELSHSCTEPNGFAVPGLVGWDFEAPRAGCFSAQVPQPHQRTHVEVTAQAAVVQGVGYHRGAAPVGSGVLTALITGPIGSRPSVSGFRQSGRLLEGLARSVHGLSWMV